MIKYKHINMSTYVMSDLHGCKNEFDQMLKLIDFSTYDELWIVGDVCDRGRASIPLLLEIMQNDNMHLVFGNHDLWLDKYAQTMINLKEDTMHFDMPDDFVTWTHFNGGLTTMDQFMDLDSPTCYDIKLYLENKVFYQYLKIKGQKFLLVHAGLSKEYLLPNTRMSSVPSDSLVWAHIGIDDNPFQDCIMVVGHTPTFLYGEESDGQIIKGKNNTIYHIDCGCVYGRKLGCLRLDDLQEFYIDSTYPRL